MPLSSGPLVELRTNCPRLMPNLPSEVPTGGAGVACPPGTWNFAWPVLFGFCHVSFLSLVIGIGHSSWKTTVTSDY